MTQRFIFVRILIVKTILQSALINGFSLFILTQALSGVKITGGLATYVLGGFLLSILYTVLKPVLNLISLPINIVTLGLFSFLTNAILFYILTVLLPNIIVTEYTFPGAAFLGFVIPEIFFNTLMAYVTAAFLQSFIVNLLTWLIKR